MKTAGAACDTWELLFDLVMATRPHVPAVAAEYGLTEAQCHLLHLLGQQKSVTMRCLAKALACDASNITGIVDRLEARGLVARQAATHDRRVKQLVLTAAGAALRAELAQRLAQPPAAFARLSAEDQQALRNLLRKALAR